ncbi:hydantoinase/oxoprolinase family protein [Actinomadura rudentiformis]|uniref:Hydantoinase/oxoprolinase family protein n=1 Tax=Actinomadura rudentiformis TaxID=359158 RepID=A0A6H9YP77_9ACTN|nr:hydantoinase/oxoprolinase family protein [Actinomadura rudentiformis]KAB2341804.1 hydantoinase/oxoprolinase family protein [Actinomadura rudentiformis]
MTVLRAELTLASDVGGTFTDVVLTGDDGRVQVAKTLTTPEDPAIGLLRGVRQVLGATGVPPARVGRFVHATTLATNVILERTGVPVAFVTTEGFRSMLALGRQARVEEERYDLAYEQPDPPVPLTHTFAVPERVGATGEVLRPLHEEAADRVAREIAALGVAAVAICLLHSYLNPVHEQRLAQIIAARLPAGTPVVESAAVWPELGEYERATTTLMSAYVGPVMASYLNRLGGGLAELGITAPIHVMESAGGVLPAALAASRAVYTIESGPAAGVIAAARQGADRGLADLISFDMGGTTAKAGLVRGGRPGITHEFQVGGKGSFGGRRPGTGVPIKVPAIDLAEVGSGGGSIAWVDAGTLRVGPRSAGADPGPACYGRGGESPTVTDANLVLGYLDPDGFGEFRLSAERARAAIAEHVAGPLGVDVVEAAAAIHDIANAQMGAAVHVVTVRRGIDPRGFTLVALGGAAPTHVARLAERFGIGRVLVPPQAGVGSAVGLLHADLAIERARTFLAPASTLMSCSASRESLGELAEIFTDLERAARSDLSIETGATVVRSVGVRFIGQAHAFTIELPPGQITPETVQRATEEFYKRYHESYGIDLRDPVELTTARVRVVIPSDPPPLPRADTAPDAQPRTREIWLDGAFGPVPVLERAACRSGEELAGPCVITEPQCSLLVPPGWRAIVDERGAILLERTHS